MIKLLTAQTRTHFITYSRTMESLKPISWIVILSATFTSITVATRTMGPFYIYQEGFFPRVAETDYFSYDTVVHGTKQDSEDRRVYGNFTAKKTMRKLKFETEMFKESNRNWQKFGLSVKLDSPCNSKLENFERCFSGKLNKEDCSMAAGSYYLDGYNIEYDIKAASEKMIYGHWRFVILMKGEIDGKTVDIATITYQMHIYDEDKRPKPKTKSNKQRGKKN